MQSLVSCLQTVSQSGSAPVLTSVSPHAQHKAHLLPDGRLTVDLQHGVVGDTEVCLKLGPVVLEFAHHFRGHFLEFFIGWVVCNSNSTMRELLV